MSLRKCTSAARRRLVRALVLTATVGASVLPAAVASAEDLPDPVVLGTLVQGWAEAGPDQVDAGQADDAQVAWIQPADGDAVPVDPEDVAGITPGSTVSARVDDADGDAQGDADADGDIADLEDVAVVSAPQAPALADPAGLTNQVTVALVRPGGVPADATTEAQVVDAVQGPVADFWSEQTDGAVRVGVTESHDWLSTSADCSDPTKLWNEVAATIGFSGGPHQHLLLYISGAAAGCFYALAEVGAAPGTGGRLYVTAVEPSSIAHELGHNFGLGHSSAQQCDRSVEAGSCRTVAYRDYYDVMGASWAQLGSLNAPQAAALKLLPGAAQASLSVRDAVTTVTLSPLSGRSGTRAVRLTDAANTTYWLEYRPAAARDAWLGTGANAYRLQSGVLLRRAGAMPDTSVLLDGTPSASAGWAADFQTALPVGSAVPVSDGDFSVVVQSVSAAGAVVSITPVPPASAAAPARRAAGGATPEVLPDAPAPAAAPVTPGFWAPASVGRVDLSAGPQLQEAAKSTTKTGVLVAAAGTVLAGSSLVSVRWLRRRMRFVPMR